MKEFNLYLLYPGRKFLPFKSRAFIDLVLESTAKSPEQKQPALAANRRRYMAEEPIAGVGGLKRYDRTRLPCRPPRVRLSHRQGLDFFAEPSTPGCMIMVVRRDHNTGALVFAEAIDR